MSTLKTYTVRFTSITSYKLTLKARDGRSAIAKAKHEWFDGDAAKLTPFHAEDHGWDAECDEVQP